MQAVLDSVSTVLKSVQICYDIARIMGMRRRVWKLDLRINRQQEQESEQITLIYHLCVRSAVSLRRLRQNIVTGGEQLLSGIDQCVGWVHSERERKRERERE